MRKPKYCKQIEAFLAKRDSKYFRNGDFEDFFSPQEIISYLKDTNFYDLSSYLEYIPTREESIDTISRAFVMLNKKQHFSSGCKRFLLHASMELVKCEKLTVLTPKKQCSGGIHFMTLDYNSFTGLDLCMYQVWNDRKIDISKCRMLDHQIMSVGATKGVIIGPTGFSNNSLRTAKQNVGKIHLIDNDAFAQKYRTLMSEII